jgi:hypothetical protein
MCQWSRLAVIRQLGAALRTDRRSIASLLAREQLHGIAVNFSTPNPLRKSCVAVANIAPEIAIPYALSSTGLPPAATPTAHPVADDHLRRCHRRPPLAQAPPQRLAALESTAG